MSKEAAYAATFIGAAYGYRTGQRDATHDFFTNLRKVSTYSRLAADMVEAAEEMAMCKPDNYESMVYDEFGNWYAEYWADCGKHPEQEDCRFKLAELTHAFFSPDLTDTQRNSLALKLQEIGETP